jgi:uncharacterized Zn finger protein
MSRMDLSGTRCSRCRSRATVQSAIELRPRAEYLTLRCISCGLVYDAQVPSRSDEVHNFGVEITPGEELRLKLLFEWMGRRSGGKIRPWARVSD